MKKQKMENADVRMDFCDLNDDLLLIRLLHTQAEALSAQMVAEEIALELERRRTQQAA